MKIVKFVPVFGILLYSACIYADEGKKPSLSIGADYSIDFQPYKGKRTYQSVLPTAFYDNDKIYIEGDEVGAYLLNDDKNELRLDVGYDGSSYDPSGRFSGLDRRKWTVMGGASYMRITPIGGFKTQVATDLLSRSKGTYVTASYLAEIKKNNWSFYPEIGLQWNDTKYNQYYYGVSEQESQRTGIQAYKPNSSVNPYLSLATNYDFSKHWSAFGTLDVNYLSNRQAESPIVDRHLDINPSFGIRYTF